MSEKTYVLTESQISQIREEMLTSNGINIYVDKIRADAIEEYKQAVLDAIIEAKSRGEEHCVLKVFMDNVAEQLKEKE